MRRDFADHIYGVIEKLTAPIYPVDVGMRFCFNGKTLLVFTDVGTDSDFMFKMSLMEAKQGDASLDVVIEGSYASSNHIFFHVSGYPGYRDQIIQLPVIAFWSFESGFEFKDVGKVRFSGLSIESFCPMGSVTTNIEKDSRVIVVEASSKNAVDLGTAVVDDAEVGLSANSYWEYHPFKHIEFRSCLECVTSVPSYDFVRVLYLSIASAVRFCLGRGNVDFDIELCAESGNSWASIGYFEVIHGATHIPDERDEAHVQFVRAQDIGLHFGKLVSAFAGETFMGKELSESREDANLITLAKVIELTSSFEREFRELFPDGVEHRTKTQRSRDLAKESLMKAAEGLSSDSKRILHQLCERIDDDNLESCIKYAFKSFSESIIEAIFSRTGANRKNTQLGKRITKTRNDIAHGNKLTHKLVDIRSEYRLLIHLVFAMRLKRLDIPDEDIVNLVRCIG